VHGWPELAYSWKPIIGPLAKAGYRVIAYDLRGFGKSSAPDDGLSRGAHHYGIAQQVGDLEAVMDAYGLSDAIICGHDWGGIIVWHAARMIASRVSGVISICTPHVGEAPADPIKIFKKRHRQPTLMLAAENDVFLPPTLSDGIEKLVPNTTRHIIPDCGHWAMWEQPEAILKRMKAWLKTL